MLLETACQSRDVALMLTNMVCSGHTDYGGAGSNLRTACQCFQPQQLFIPDSLRDLETPVNCAVLCREWDDLQERAFWLCSPSPKGPQEMSVLEGNSYEAFQSVNGACHVLLFPQQTFNGDLEYLDMLGRLLQVPVFFALKLRERQWRKRDGLPAGRGSLAGGCGSGSRKWALGLQSFAAPQQMVMEEWECEERGWGWAQSSDATGLSNHAESEDTAKDSTAVCWHLKE